MYRHKTLEAGAHLLKSRDFTLGLVCYTLLVAVHICYKERKRLEVEVH